MNNPPTAQDLPDSRLSGSPPNRSFVPASPSSPRLDKGGDGDNNGRSQANLRTDNTPSAKVRDELDLQPQTNPSQSSLGQEKSSANPSPSLLLECSSGHNLLMLIITSCYTLLHIVFAFTSNRKLVKFYGWVLTPVCVTAMMISVCLMPRRTEAKYTIFLIVQYLLLSGTSEVCMLIGYEFDKDEVIRSSCRCVGWISLGFFFVRFRRTVAALPDEKLSDFLSYMFKHGTYGLVQTTFLMFDSFRCDLGSSTGFAGSFGECKRTLYSQTGLGGIVALYTLMKLVSWLVPEHILSKHVIRPNKMLSMRLNPCEKISAVGLTISGTCSLYLLGQFGAEGDFDDVEEEWFMAGVMTVGGMSLLLTGLLVSMEVRADMKREAEEEANTDRSSVSKRRIQIKKAESLSRRTFASDEISSFWIFTGFAATTLMGLVEISVVRLGPNINGPFIFPLVLILYVIALFAKPKRNGMKYRVFLWIHFTSFGPLVEVANIVKICMNWMGRMDSSKGFNIAVHAVRTFVWIALFKLGLKLRASVARLPDAELSKYLDEKLFVGGLKILAPILFVIFRATNCIVEDEDDCQMTVHCSAYIAAYLSIFWCYRLTQAAVVGGNHLDPVNLATLNLKWREIAQALLGLVVIGCGTFLFALMNAAARNWGMIKYCGLTGLFSALIILAIEAYNLIYRVSSTAVPEPEILVNECSWGFIFGSVLQTSSYVGFCAAFAITLENEYRIIASMFLPIVAVSFVISFFMKPLKTERWYRTFQHAHFVVFSLVSETLTAIGQFRQRETLYAIASIGRFFIIWLPQYWIGNNLLSAVATLPESDLSHFLVQILLVRGSAAMGPMIFFSFETMQCVASEGVGSMDCRNTAISAVCLSAYLVALTAYSIANKGVPWAVQKKLQISWRDFATFNISKRQRIQVFLVTITITCSFYLFSVIGVVSSPSSLVFCVGALGGVTATLALLSELVVTWRLFKALEKMPGSFTSRGQGRAASTTDRVSVAGIGDGLVLGALV